MVTSECEPFAKTGGLADVVDALARALGQLGHEVDVYLPRYRGLEPPGVAESLDLHVPTPFGEVKVTVFSSQANGYRLRLIDRPQSFDRPTYYGEGADYPDNSWRFTLLGRAALETMRAEGRPVDVIHAHDWEGAPALLLLRHRYGDSAALGKPGTVLTCHNLAYHGWVTRDQVGPQLDQRPRDQACIQRSDARAARSAASAATPCPGRSARRGRCRRRRTRRSGSREPW